MPRAGPPPRRRRPAPGRCDQGAARTDLPAQRHRPAASARLSGLPRRGPPTGEAPRARAQASRRARAADPPVPRGTLFFIHGANETSEGLARNVTRIQDQVAKRGWDVTVVAPEWRRRSGLRLGAWKQAVFRGGRPPTIPIPNSGAGVRKDAVMKIVTSYFEYRREALFETIGAQMLADVIGYHRHRDIDPRRPARGARAGGRAAADGSVPSCRSRSASAGSPSSTSSPTGRRRRSRRA